MSAGRSKAVIIGLMQVEEAYIGAEEFCKRLQQDEEAVLSTEALVLQGLNFDLITYTPYSSLSGYFTVSISQIFI